MLLANLNKEKPILLGRVINKKWNFLQRYQKLSIISKITEISMVSSMITFLLRRMLMKNWKQKLLELRK